MCFTRSRSLVWSSNKKCPVLVSSLWDGGRWTADASGNSKGVPISGAVKIATRIPWYTIKTIYLSDIYAYLVVSK